jgi:hypothetical protein
MNQTPHRKHPMIGRVNRLLKRTATGKSCPACEQEIKADDRTVTWRGTTYHRHCALRSRSKG